jgi:prepilin-type N-terminal cleavage/methylation domain-containing protein
VHLRNKQITNSKKGFTIVEVIVAMALLGVLVIIASGLLIPLKITNQSNAEGRAANLARSYIEILKSRWQVQTNYSNSPYNVPVVSSTITSADIKLPIGWTFTVNSADWTSSDTLRTVKITVKPDANDSVSDVVLETIINRPT